MTFDIVIPFYNGNQYLNTLLASIPESLGVIIVDDLSDDPPNFQRSNTRLIQMDSKGYFTGAVNRGIKASDKDILILNQDTYFTGDRWLNFIEQNRDTYHLIGEQAGTHPAWPNRYIHGTFMYIRRELIDVIGLMDDKHYPHWGSTADYQVRACRKGYKALPAQIPNFTHLRQGHFGSATQQVMDGKKGKLIRTPPEISVIITCYNYGRYLQDAVNSLIGGETSLGYHSGQTFQGFEIVIVDDGSTDDSAKIAESLADEWKGIHFVSQPNQGSAVAMNTGIEYSHARSGHFIAPLDGDDMMKPDRLERMLNTYLANPHSAIYDNVTYFANGQEGIVLDWQNPDKKRNTLDLGDYDFDRMLHKNSMHKGLLYPKKAWEQTGGYPVLMNKGREDWAFNIALGSKGWCGVNTGHFDYLYRREGQNRTLTNTTPKWRQIFLEQLKEIFPEIYGGYRPPMCCGRPTKNGNGVAMAQKKSNEMVGKEGWVILEYQGANAGDETWYGDYGTYVLGGAKRRGYVDQRDRNKLLAIRERGKPVFKEYVAPVETKPIEIKPQLPDWETVQDLTEITSQTVSKLKSTIPDLTSSQLEALLKVETRVTAKTAIEAELNARLA